MTRKNRRAVTGNAIIPGMRVTLPFGELTVLDDLGYVDYVPTDEVEIHEIDPYGGAYGASVDTPYIVGGLWLNPDEVYSVR